MLKEIEDLTALAVVPGTAYVVVQSAGTTYKALVSALPGGGGGGGGFYQTVESNGTPVTQRATLNVTGLLSVSDSGGKTVLTLAAIALASQVTGVLPVANGGTGLSALGSAGQSYRVNAGGTALEFYTPSAGLNAPANPADDGKVAVATGGNLSYALVSNVHIASGAAVALSKLANINADRLLGRDTAGSGAIEELSVSGGIEFTGGGGLQRSALSGVISAAAGSNTTTYASGDFGALPLTTTAHLIMAATPATTGNIRWGSDTGYSIVGRTTGGTDRSVLLYDPVTPRIALGANGADVAGHVYLNASDVQLRVGTDYIARAVAGQFSLNTSVNITAVAGSTFSIHPLDSSGSGAVAGGVTLRGGEATNGAGGGTGGAVTVRGGDATGGGGTRNGGNLTVRPGNGATAQGTLSLQSGGGTNRIQIDATGLGFFATTPAAKQTVTGSRGGNAALASLLTGLATMGLLTDSSSA